MTDHHDPDSLDEQLSALLDGELDPGTAAELQRRLAEDPALARRYDELKGADAAFREALSELDEQPLPESVSRLIRENDGAAARGGVLPLRQRAQPARRWVPVALAASIALVVGFVAARLLPAPQLPSADTMVTGAVAPRSPLHEVLETQPSGATTTLADGTRAAPVQTFRTADGTVCRELQLSAAAGSRHAVACRSAGAWQIRLAEFRQATEGYTTASAAGSMVSQAVREWKAGESLPPDAESKLLESW